METSDIKVLSAARWQRNRETMDYQKSLTVQNVVCIYNSVLSWFKMAPLLPYDTERGHISLSRLSEQSKSEKISPWDSQTNVSFYRLPSSVCQTNAQNLDGPQDRTDIVWESKQSQKIGCGSSGQSDTAERGVLNSYWGSKACLMHH